VLCAAPDAPLHTRVTVRYEDVPLAVAMKDIGTKAGVAFTGGEKLLEKADSVTYAATDQEAGRVATRILRPRGMKLAQLDGRAPAIVKLDALDEFKIKREELFDFAEQPKVLRTGDQVTITFATKGWCDVTVALEDPDGRIIRHLASGVLGENAPEPFLWNSTRQSLVWDGKNDQGRYVDDKESLALRVSLGLKPQFERTLFWSPKKRMSNACPLLSATPEGVYLFEGRGVDFVRFFDHDGNYVRTIFPFPADKLERVVGLQTRTFPQDGKSLPVKTGFTQSSLLTSGTSAILALPYKFGDGYGATAMAVQGHRMALCYNLLNRLSTDGATGGFKLTGPKVSKGARWSGYGGQGGGDEIIGPASAAFSPDGKTLYLTGYWWREMYMGGGNTLHGVMKMDYEGDAEPVMFAGEMKADGGEGNDAAHFCVPTSVACDSNGRVYVTDHMNDRIQIFDPQGRLLKSIACPKPSKILINPKSGEIWVFSWPAIGISNDILKRTGFDWDKLPSRLIRFASFDDPRQIANAEFPLGVNSRGFFLMGPMVDVAVDWWAPAPTVWLIGRKHNISRIDVAWGGSGSYRGRDNDGWKNDGVRMLREKDGKWEEQRSFAADAKEAVVRLKPPDFARQRLYAHPRTGKLYVAEDSGFGKSFFQLIEIDPVSGKSKLVEMPFDAEDICFDSEGMIYLRTDTLVVRYDFTSWREIPWDYGEERKNVYFSSISANRTAETVVSGLPTPGKRPVCWNQGGMSVSPLGSLVVSCCNYHIKLQNRAENSSLWQNAIGQLAEGKAYMPEIYPGRPRWQEAHIWNRHGSLVAEDAIPGTTILNGIEIDRNGDLYVMAAANRILDGKPYWNEMAGTVMKLRPHKARVVSSNSGDVPLAPEALPKRPPDIERGMGGTGWVLGAEWMYGGVGFGGFNGGPGGGCHCWNSKFCVDAFGRSFAPETDHFSVAVLDANGNLILRVGRYGNVDDGVPLRIAERSVKSGEPPNQKSIGGDEVALFHPAYTGTHTDRRLFITDAGNGRIVSVNLGYQADARVAMKDTREVRTAGAGQPR
jgi:hypothetical protein